MATDERVRLKKQAFIDAYRTHGTITAAATHVGIHRSQHYDWMGNDPAYKAEFAHAEEAVADMLEREAVRRAAEGVERAVYHKGEVVGSERHFSDTLLIFLLKGLRPEKFKDRAHVTQDVVVTEGDTVDREIERLAAELARRAEGRTAGRTPLASGSTA